MACNCNCNYRNGRDVIDFFTSFPGGTAANATYELGLTHFTCGGQQLLVTPDLPVRAELTLTPIGSPIDLGNNAYCQECKIAGTVSYCPCSNPCRVVTESISQSVCVPCSSAVSPTLTVGTVVASPKPITVYVNTGCGCCQQQKASTNQIAITTSINVATA